MNIIKKLLHFFNAKMKGNNTKIETSEGKYIPENAMETIAGIFGFTKPTANYTRWVSHDGCKYRDVSDVLSDSRFYIICDWREYLEEVLLFFKEALLYWEIKTTLTKIEDTSYEVTIGNQVFGVEKNSEYENWLPIVKKIQESIPERIEIRASVYNDSSDTDVYIVLLKTEWEKLEKIEYEYFGINFRKIA
jgi:hypothetical protein